MKTTNCGLRLCPCGKGVDDDGDGNCPACAHGRVATIEVEVRARMRRNELIEKIVAQLVQWTHEHDAALNPRAGLSDSFGDGMRCAKDEVARIINGDEVDEVDGCCARCKKYPPDAPLTCSCGCTVCYDCAKANPATKQPWCGGCNPVDVRADG